MNINMVNKFFFIVFFQFFCAYLVAEEESTWKLRHNVQEENVSHFYYDEKSNHSYVQGMNCSLDFLGYGDYSITFSVDTVEMSLTYARDSLVRFFRVEFFEKDKKLATFDNDNCWTCLRRRPDGVPLMYYAHQFGDCLALVFQGEAWSDCVPEFTIFMIHDHMVSVIYNKENAILQRIVKNDKTIYKCLTELGEVDPPLEPKFSDIVFDDYGISCISLEDKKESVIFSRIPAPKVKSVGSVIFNGLLSRDRIMKNLYGSDIPWTGGNKEVTITFKNLVIESDKGDSYTFPELSLEMFRKYFPDTKIDISLNPSINDAFEVADYKAENWDLYLGPWEDFRVWIYKQTAGGVIVAACDISEIFGGDHPTTDVVHTLGFKITATSKSGTTILLDQNTSSKCIPLVQMAP